MRRPGTGSGSWARRLAVALLAGAGAGAALVFLESLDLGLVANLVLVLAGTVIGAGLAWTAADLYPGARPAYWSSSVPPRHRPRRGGDFRLYRLRRDLRYTLEDNREADAIRPLLISLVEERLLSRHGVRLRTEPEAARHLLGPTLARYVAAPPGNRRRRSRSHLTTILDRIEEL